MGLGCAAKSAKCFLFVFNILFFLLGATAIALGIFVLVDKQQLVYLTKLGGIDQVDVPGLLETSCYVLIAGGGCVFIIGFLGCCGAFKEIRSFLLIYAILVLIILLAEIGAGVVAYFFRDKVINELKSFLNETIAFKYEGQMDTAEPFSLAWDLAHITFDCCGMDNSTDFDVASAWNKTYAYTVGSTTFSANMVIPPTCCKFKDKSLYPLQIDQLEMVENTCPINPNATISWMNEGCYQKIYDLIMTNAILIMAVGIGIGAVEIVGIISACCLASAIRKENESVEDLRGAGKRRRRRRSS